MDDALPVDKRPQPSRWQTPDGLTEAVLLAVFEWLDGRSLAVASGVCRAWRFAAAAAPWRRLLGEGAVDTSLQGNFGHSGDRSTTVAWREEYVRVHAPWRLAGKRAAGRALLHAALAPCGMRLALAADDAHAMIWELEEGEEWREVWQQDLSSRGWEGVARAEWASAGKRLLLAGPVALAHRWELIVLLNHEGGWSVSARAASGAGAAGGWAGRAGHSFLALRPRTVAHGRSLTTVYINAATQETQSEFEGVTAPLLHIFNEDNANITHVAVADVPLQDKNFDEEYSSDDENEYTDKAPPKLVLIAGFAGPCGVLRAWSLRSPRPPPLVASLAGDLRERRRARRDATAEPETEMSEAEVRAMCTAPDAEGYLLGTLIGLTVQDNGRCVWACVAGGVLSSWALPGLQLLRQLPPPCGPSLHPIVLHYVHPAVNRHYIATPEGGLSGRVWVWGAVSGARGPTPLTHTAPALAVAFPLTNRPTLLVLTSEYLYMWESLATPQMTEYELYDTNEERSSLAYDVTVVEDQEP